ncbi:hypothetical protein [Nocardia sp. NPDC052566]|uniref:hypothetical protein n=1 Tax=Nocardia sp. NPDC052566 TaxID=3364330 RepID=UPI0037CA3D96
MTRFLAVLSGVLLVGAVTLLEPWLGIPAMVLVAVGWFFRLSAVAAVLLAIGVLASVDADVLHAAAAGLVATTYLLNTATVTAPSGVVPTTIPSVLGALLFTGAAVSAALLPIRLAWAPAFAPFVVIALYVLLIQDLSRRRNGGETAENA